MNGGEGRDRQPEPTAVWLIQDVMAKVERREPYRQEDVVDGK
jgi:hypothetical protein